MRCTHGVGLHSHSAHVRRRSEKSPSFGFCQVYMYACYMHGIQLINTPLILMSNYTYYKHGIQLINICGSSGETKCGNGATIPLSFHSLSPPNSQFFLYRGDRQMTEIFVSWTEVFNDAKMTECPYE